MPHCEDPYPYGGKFRQECVAYHAHENADLGNLVEVLRDNENEDAECPDGDDAVGDFDDEAVPNDL